MGLRKFFAYMYDTVAKTFKVGDTSGSNYTEFESDGTMKMVGDATVYDDAFPVQLYTPTDATAPDLVTLAGNIKTWSFDGGSLTETLAGSIEMPHMYKEGTDIDFHIHQTTLTTATGNIKWTLEYVWCPLSGLIPTTTTITSAINTIASGDARKSKMVTIGTISGLGVKISDVLCFRLSRNASDAQDNFTADALVLAMGSHYQKDTLGSRTTYEK